MPVTDVLDKLRASSTSESDKGARFERMMRSAFRLDRTYRERFTDVWLWSDWPGRRAEPDTGIDLVARSAAGGYTAVQCKFFAEEQHLVKADIDSFFTASGRAPFTERIIVCTTDLWSTNAERALDRQDKPVTRIGVDELQAMTIAWEAFDPDRPADLVETPRHELRPHQAVAVEKVLAGLGTADRGQLIMACGTGKTFTSLRVAEQQVGAGGTVLLLAPSIALVSQTLKEWTGQATVPVRPFAVCSDSTAGRPVDGEIGTPYDLAVPPTTDPEVLAAAGAATPDPAAMTVVFSTYQSLSVVAACQAVTGLVFDLVVCDEAHRTAGTSAKDEERSAFVLVHDDAAVPARKRLYMTATPRIYQPAAKLDAEEADVVVASMDDPAVFGPELHRLGFGEAVTRGLLADYRVLILTVGEEAISESFQDLLSTDGDLNLPDIAKIVGCLAGLSKRGTRDGAFGHDEEPMRRAVAFWSTIAESKRFAEQVDAVAERYQSADGTGGLAPDGARLVVPTRHVDGTTDIRSRRTDIRWLEQEPPDDECRVLTNAQCLTEGVDVPALDAVMFLKPRRSTIDIVQAVGRVMRKPPGKEIGYIILPVVVPVGQSPEQALESNPDYDVVWSVLQALRSHDERFNSYVNRIQYLSEPPDRDPQNPIEIVDVSASLAAGEGQATYDRVLPGMDRWEEWTGAIYARIVQKVGSRTYWEDWAADVIDVARRHHKRIVAILAAEPEASAAFDRFLTGLRGNLNDSITTDDAIAMVSQHLITRPIFEALFGTDNFARTNPVAQAMQQIADVLDRHHLDTETASLDRFYDSVRQRIEGIPPEDGAARQRIIKDLYGRFFKRAFPAAAESLGIVYTPIEVVDFILRAAEAALREHFDGASISDEGVHVLDPFTGTATFVTRLLQSDLIQPDDLARKYTKEIHANEILLLAYYIAAVNIETTYRQVSSGAHVAFPGIVLTDTFQLGEGQQGGAFDVFPVNNERAERQNMLDLRVIIGNPPYSAGQSSANDNNANVAYPALDESIRQTYAARSTATRKSSLYDSYLRAIRWASRRVIEADEGGVVAYVTNGGWIDGNTADGVRLILAREFHHVYVYNLRGNQRTAGEQSRREGGKIFGAGSRNTVAITLLVKLPGEVPPTGAQIRYRDIGAYLNRSEKLRILDEGLRSTEFGVASLDSLGWQTITPNAHGDWINQRSDSFDRMLALHADDEPSVFAVRTNGLKSNRDAWNYNASLARLQGNTRRMIAHYNAQVNAFHTAHPDVPGTQRERAAVAKAFVDRDPTRFSWDRADFNRLVQGVRYDPDDANIMPSVYRAFARRYANAAPVHNNSVYKLPRVFPDAGVRNMAIGVLDPGGSAPFTVLMVDQLPDDKLVGAGNAMQFLARWTFDEVVPGDDSQLRLDQSGSGRTAADNVTDDALAMFRELDDAVTKDDLFYYVYGVLHAPDYRETCASDLRRSLPRIPRVDAAKDFWAFSRAGRELSHLHTQYEDVDVWPTLDIRYASAFDPGNPNHLRVTKMRYGKRPHLDDPRDRRIDDPSTIVCNDLVTIAGIPERVHEYRLGARSALDWVVEQQQVKTDKASGITTDPNDWATEHGDPQYILDLVGRVVTVSMRTLDIVDALPPLDLTR